MDKRENIESLLAENRDKIIDFIMRGEVVTVAPSRSGAKLLHAPKASRFGFVRVEIPGGGGVRSERK